MALPLDIISNLLKLLTGSNTDPAIVKMRQQRKNLRKVMKARYKLERKFKKNGFTDKEKEILNSLDESIAKRLLELGYV